MEAVNTLIFGKWDTKEVKVLDVSLARYVNLQAKKIPHTFGRVAKKRFEKANISIVERLINKVMRSGQGKRKLSGKYIRGRGSCGKKLQAMGIVERAFERVEKETKQNPIQVFIKAIENSAPREDVTRIKKGGIMYSQAVDVSPMKRVDESLKNIALAAFSGSFNNKKKAEDALAEEIIAASKEDSKSFSVKRRDEVERIA
ncbi:MAG TPA: 30S ribosomal protein S7, partial [archaeon]|nr:30S ribosomal protein S7 [archaeon]